MSKNTGFDEYVLACFESSAEVDKSHIFGRKTDYANIKQTSNSNCHETTWMKTAGWV